MRKCSTAAPRAGDPRFSFFCGRVVRQKGQWTQYQALKNCEFQLWFFVLRHCLAAHSLCDAALPKWISLFSSKVMWSQYFDLRGDEVKCVRVHTLARPPPHSILNNLSSCFNPELHLACGEQPGDLWSLQALLAVSEISAGKWGCAGMECLHAAIYSWALGSFPATFILLSVNSWCTGNCKQKNLNAQILGQKPKHDRVMWNALFQVKIHFISKILCFIFVRIFTELDKKLWILRTCSFLGIFCSVRSL